MTNNKAGKADAADDRLWTVEQVADFLQVSVPHIYRLCSTLRLPHVKPGDVLRFEPDQVRKWVAERRVKAVK